MPTENCSLRARRGVLSVGRMNRAAPIRNLALIGFMGTGKSSVGRLVAAQLQFAFVDTDQLIEERAGRSISQIFADDGEPAFRALEQEVVQSLAGLDRTVIATGGGLGANPENLARLKEHALVVCLWASPATIFERVGHQTHRPLLQQPDPETKIRALLAEREAVYKQADALVSSDCRSCKEVAQHVLHQFSIVREQNAR